MREKREKWDFDKFQHPRFLGDSWMWWREFLEGKADKTRRNYITNLKNFMVAEDYTTETLFEEHKKNTRADDPREAKRLGSKVYQYMKRLIEGGKSTGSANNVEKALRSFFSANELPFKINGEIKVITSEIPTITNEHLALVLDVCGSVRLKAGIHVLKESGMRISDLVNIRVEDIDEAITGNLEFFTWTITQQKTGSKADPVVGPEAIRWLKLWMAKRDLDGVSSEWVFTTVENYSDNRQIGEQMSPDTIGQLFRHYRDKAGIQPAKGETRKPTIHSLRKRHKTKLESIPIPASWINKMQGRVGEGTGGVYTKPNQKELIEMYQRGYEALSIEGRSKAEQIQQMEHRLEQRDKTLDQITQNQMEIMSKMSLYAPLIDDLIEANKEGRQLTDLDQRLKALKVKPVKE